MDVPVQSAHSQVYIIHSHVREQQQQQKTRLVSLPLFDLDPETSSTAAVVTSDNALRKLLQNPVARIKGQARHYMSKLDAAIHNMMILMVGVPAKHSSCYDCGLGNYY